jgi:hypothetical protein
MNLHRILLLTLVVCTGADLPAQTDRRDHDPPPAWSLRKDQDGIKVYCRAGDNSGFDELKVETVLPGRLSSLAALILDVGNYPNWSFNSEKAYVLKTIGPAELYFYSLVHSPWPASDRDLAVHLLIRQDSSTRKLYISTDEIANFIPEKKGIVRVPLSVERWVITPLPGDRIGISYELRLNPGASAPAWLINLFAVRGPFETFSHLREQLNLPRYHGATLPFIRN